MVSSTLFALRTHVTRGAGSGRPLFPFGPTQLLLSHHLPDLTRDALASEVRKPPLTQIVFLPFSVPGKRLEGMRNFLLVHTGIGRKGCRFLASGTTGGPQVEDANGAAWGQGPLVTVWAPCQGRPCACTPFHTQGSCPPLEGPTLVWRRLLLLMSQPGTLSASSHCTHTAAVDLAGSPIRLSSQRTGHCVDQGLAECLGRVLENVHFTSHSQGEVLSGEH